MSDLKLKHLIRENDNNVSKQKKRQVKKKKQT